MQNDDHDSKDTCNCERSDSSSETEQNIDDLCSAHEEELLQKIIDEARQRNLLKD